MAYKKRSSSYKKKSYGERKDAHQMLAESILKNIEESNLVFPTRERRPGTVFKPGNGRFGAYNGMNALRTDQVAEGKGYLDEAIDRHGKDLGMILGNKYVTYDYVSKNPDMFGEYAMKGKKSDMSVMTPGLPYWTYEDNEGKAKKWYSKKDENGKYREPSKAEIEELGLEKRMGQSKLVPVFNLMQFDETPEKLVKKAEKELDKIIKNPIEHMENSEIRQDVSEAMGIKVRETMNIEDNVGGFYTKGVDSISLRPAAVYENENHLMRIFFHEMTHATGAEDRLNRSTLKNYGESDEQRAKEELVAELGSAFLCQHFGIETNTLGHEGYLAGWMTRIKDDPNFLKSAVFEASQGANFVIDKYEQHYDKKYGVDLKAEKDSVVIPYEEKSKEQEEPKKEKKPKLSGKTVSMEM